MAVANAPEEEAETSRDSLVAEVCSVVAAVVDVATEGTPLKPVGDAIGAVGPAACDVLEEVVERVAEHLQPAPKVVE